MTKAKTYKPWTGAQLKEKRERLKMTQEEYAHEVLGGTSVKNVRNWEQGQRQIPDWVPNMHRVYLRVRELEDE